MATFGLTFIPILVVLKNSGSIKLDKLTEELNSDGYGRFGSIENIERIIEHYSGCLKIEGADTVVFDHQAKRYAYFGIMERDIDFLLHENIPDMKRFELYPHKSHKNSPTCPMGVTWEHIPKKEHLIASGRNPYECNYRSDGEHSCSLHCGLEREKFKILSSS